MSKLILALLVGVFWGAVAAALQAETWLIILTALAAAGCTEYAMATVQSGDERKRK